MFSVRYYAPTLKKLPLNTKWIIHQSVYDPPDEHIERRVARELDRHAQHIGDREDILVAAARQVDEDDLIGAHGRREFQRFGYGMRAFERRNDALLMGEHLEGGERFFIADRRIVGPLLIVKPRVLGSNSGVIKTSRDAVRQRDLAVIVLQH